MEQQAFAGRDLAPGDIGQMVRALLDAIDRGELRATNEEVRFLRSVASMLSSA